MARFSNPDRPRLRYTRRRNQRSEYDCGQHGGCGRWWYSKKKGFNPPDQEIGTFLKTIQSSSSSSSGSYSSSSQSTSSRSSSSRSSSSRSSSSRSSGGRGSNSSQDSRSDRSSNRSDSRDPPSIIGIDNNHHFLDEMVGYGYGYRTFTRTFNQRRGRDRRQPDYRGDGRSFSERHRRSPSQSPPPISARERHQGSGRTVSQSRRFDINSGINNLRISDTSD